MSTMALDHRGFSALARPRVWLRGTVVLMASSTQSVELVELMARIRGGDQQAFASLYDATSRNVFGIVLRVLRDRAQSEEVTQEVYLEAWRSAQRFDVRLGSPTAWLNTIAHRKAVDRVRSSERSTQREQRHFRAESVLTPDDPSELAAIQDDGRRVRAALRRLPAAQRAALELAYYGGRTQAEVAAALEIPLGTVKTRMRDAMKRLRKQLGDSS